MTRSFYIACWLEDGGIYKVDFDLDTNKIVSVGKADPGVHTSYFETDGDILYSLSEIGGEDKFLGKIHSYRMTDAGLEPIAMVEGVLSGSPHLKLAHNKDTMYVASYTTGAVCSLRVKDGAFGAMTGVVEHSGTGAHPVRQEGPHAHIVCPTPDDRYIVCCDLGTDELRVYAIDETTGGLLPHSCVKVPAGYGPRHMVFSPDGEYAYVVCELKYHLLTYKYNGSGELVPVNDLTILPELPERQNWGGAIKISDDGRHLFTTNRGREVSTIDIIALDEPAAPAVVSSFTDCHHVRDFLLFRVEDAQYMTVLNMTTQETCIYKLNMNNYEFELLDVTKDIPMPVCVV